MALDHPYSFQLYSARNFPPLADQLKALADLGYTNVEPYGGQYADLEGLKAALDAAGLAAKSGHFNLAMLEDDFERAVTVAKTLGMDLVIVPAVPRELWESDLAFWQGLGRRLGAIAAKLKPLGLGLAWHNHHFEFRALPDGSMPLEHILADPAVMWEVDIAWVVRGGARPEQWIARFADRIVAFHFKDIAPEGEKVDEDGWADPGTGILPWSSYWELATGAGAKLAVAEHDNPSDYKRFAAKAIETARTLA